MPGSLLRCQEFYFGARKSTSVPGILLWCQEVYFGARKSTSVPGSLLRSQEFYFGARRSTSVPRPVLYTIFRDAVNLDIALCPALIHSFSRNVIDASSSRGETDGNHLYCITLYHLHHHLTIMTLTSHTSKSYIHKCKQGSYSDSQTTLGSCPWGSRASLGSWILFLTPIHFKLGKRCCLRPTKPSSCFAPVPTTCQTYHS